MTDYLDRFGDLVDLLAFFAGLVVLIWFGLHSPRRKRESALPSGAVIGMLTWLAVFGLALYLVFG